MINPEKLNFKHLCMTIGNLPSSYVESLSYYECLLWLCNYLENTVIPAVNNNASALEELQELFVQLQNYVDNYFENLDVQEEINNKLDEMAEDGSLTNLIKNYVDPIFEEFENEINTEIDSQNSRITSVESALQSVASGSPAGVYDTLSDLTTADPDHSRTYVVAADGKWYYYDNSSSTWVAGGIYQASEGGDSFQILNDEVDLANLNIYDETMANGGFLSNNGITSSTTFKYAEVPITENTTYYLYRESQVYNYAGDYIGFKDDQNNIFGIFKFLDNIITYNNKMYVKIKAPANAVKLLFNLKLVAFDDIKTSIVFTQPSIENFKGYDLDLRNNIDSFNNNYNLNKINLDYISNYIVTKSSNTVNYSYNLNTLSAKVNVSASKKYYLYRKSQAYNVSGDVIAFYNASDELLSFIDIPNNGVLYTLLNNDKTLVFTTPENTSYIRFNIKLTTYDDQYTTILSEIPTEYPLLANDYVLREYFNSTLTTEQPSLKNRLREKIWACLGDSITALTFRSTKNYHDYISERCGCTIVNLGRSGIGYVRKSTINMCDVVDSLDGSENYDYITIFAGTNDMSQALGDITSTSKNTVYGAIKYCVTELIRKFPTKKIGLITPLPRSSNYGTNSDNALYNIVKAIKEVGEYYSIPVLDQYISSGLRPWDSTNNETFFSCDEAPTGDGLHPNELGHEWISYDIQQFMQLL